MISSISFFSGYRSNDFLEKINSPLNVTSKTPPEDGSSVTSEILSFCSLKIDRVRATALPR